MNHEDLELKQTCFACPEQYDVYHGTEKVGYIRYRHGFFIVNPVVNGDYYFSTELMCVNFHGDWGILTYTQFADLIPKALTAIAEYHSNKEAKE